jgi:hypothetical protein
MDSIYVHSIKIILLSIVVCFLVNSDSFASTPSQYAIEIGDPNWFGDFDAAGYSDWIWYGPSASHPYAYHEILSGDWGAAVYYDSIQNGKSMWLTDLFVVPTWPTGSSFTVVNAPPSWDNPNNPAVPNVNATIDTDDYNYHGTTYTGYDTGESIIKSGDNKLQITIDFEIAKVSNGSPLAFRDASGNTEYVNSENSVLLETYTLKNTSSSSLTNVKFFQFLHSHGDDDYGATMNSTYQTIILPDSLAQYIPYNSVHTVGNFCYDITQWNDVGSADHVDYVGFSSTTQPNYIENGTYAGHGDSEPTTGVNKDIEACDATTNLNNDANMYNVEAAGAMQWNLGTIDANAQKRITVALMWSHGPICPKVAFSVSNNNAPKQCGFSAGDTLTLNAHVQGLGVTFSNVYLDINLPPNVVSFKTGSATPSANFSYNSSTRIASWNIGTLAGDANTTYSLSLNVNSAAIPGSTISIPCRLHGTNLDMLKNDTAQICCDSSGGTNIIYVDKNKTSGLKNGASWTNAFIDLQTALNSAYASCGKNTIYIAKGTYVPPKTGDLSTSYFSARGGLTIYGGFSSPNGESDPNKRQLTNLANATILSADLTGDGNSIANFVAQINGSNCILDGITFAYSSSAVFTLSNTTSLICRNCNFNDNGDSFYNGTGLNLQLYNCAFTDTQIYSLEPGGQQTISILDCNFVDSDIHLSSAGTLDIENSYFSDGDAGTNISLCNATTVKFINNIAQYNSSSDGVIGRVKYHQVWAGSKPAS